LTITLQLSDIRNAKSEGWPTKAVKRCLPGDSVMMTALIQTTGAPPATFTCTVTTTDQAPPATPRPVADQAAPPQNARPPAPPAQAAATPAKVGPFDPNFSYRLPYPHGVSCNVSQGYKGRQSHNGLYALDFEMPEGSPVCAAREGVVIEVQTAHNMGDSDGAVDNYVAIRHGDNTVALYLHMQRDRMTVKVGQHVAQCEVIGASSTTGHSNGPHLHFEVDALKDCVGPTEKGDRGSIPVVFDIFGQHKVSLVAGTSYQAE
jgi:murein DD-endopeptidase MepM/ murein hydrolase activator NlpD